jgi:tetratricopeptide (TPR) repeat protein
MATQEAQTIKKSQFIFSTALFEEQTARYAKQAVIHFRRLTRGYALFHMGYLVLGIIELFALLLFFPLFLKSSLIAFTLAALFLTAFSYFVLRFYFEAKKPEQFIELKERFVATCKKALPVENPLAVTQAVYIFLSELEGQEVQYYPLPKLLETLKPLMEKLSLWCHFQDVHLMKEHLHQYCIDQRIEYVKKQPVNIEAHTLLAQSYIALYKLYLDPRKSGKEVPYPFMLHEYSSEATVKKFQAVTRRALEELKILDAYTPNNPWVHAQMAAIYHDLGILEKEIEEYEILLRISPNDSLLLYRLGLLYFQYGKASTGLKIYEQLKKNQDPKADQLIQKYEG